VLLFIVCMVLLIRNGDDDKDIVDVDDFVA